MLRTREILPIIQE